MLSLLRTFANPKIFNFVCLCSVIWCITQSACQTSYTGTLAPTQREFIHPHDVTLYGTSDVIQIHFSITSTGKPLTTTSLVISFGTAVQFSSMQLQDFYHLNPQTQINMDLDAIWSADEQFINVYKPTGATTLYLTVFNFDPSYRQSSVSYNIDVYGTGITMFRCDNCANGQSHPYTSCFCRDCTFQTIGRTCSRMVNKLTKNSTITLAPTKLTYFAIQDSDKLTLQIAIVGGAVQAYFQFQQFQGQVANFYNVAKGSSDGRYLINNTILRLGADPQKKKLLITIANMESRPINATIGFSQESTVSVLVIVMAVLGGVLLIALVIAVICIIKRRNANAGRISSQLNLPSETNKLTGQQIQRYFPQCIFSDLQSPLAETSMHPLTTEQTQKQPTNGSQTDCVICLQQINIAETIRIGYCKHIFHSNCLISWFKKQRNCPYCRKEYNRDQTTAQYNKLVAENNNRVLKDLDLGKAIYQRKIGSKTVIENLE